MCAPSCEVWRSLAKLGDLWRTHNATFTRTSLTFTRVPTKVSHIHQSSGEGAFCVWVAFRMCPSKVLVVLSASSKPTWIRNLHSPVWVGSKGGHPSEGHKFGCVCSCMAGHYPGILMTGRIGTNTPKFVPPRWGWPPFDPTQTGLCKFGWVWSSLILVSTSVSSSVCFKFKYRTKRRPWPRSLLSAYQGLAQKTKAPLAHAKQFLRLFLGRNLARQK